VLPILLSLAALAAPDVRRMTVSELAGQMILVPFYGENLAERSKQYREYVRLVRGANVGGLVLLNRVRNGSVRYAEPLEVASFVNRMQKLARVPLVVAGDFERGASMRVARTAKFPHAMAYGVANDLELTRRTGEASAREARAMGVHWLLAPVADVNSNPDNPAINIRSYGAKAEEVAQHVRAFLEGCRKGKALCTAKHFPGQGDAGVDTHLESARAGRIELLPFREAIGAGVDAVMTGHLYVPEWESRNIPASVSDKIVSGLLRGKLAFQGLAVTDAMDMAGLTKLYPAREAAVRAVEAGNDVLVAPQNPDQAIEGIVAAVRVGRLKIERLRRSVARILAAKQRVGLFERRLVEVARVRDEIDSDEHEELAATVAAKAIRVLKDDQKLLPLKGGACVAVMAEARNTNSGKGLIRALPARIKSVWLDPTLPEEELEATARHLDDCGTVVVAAWRLYGNFLERLKAPVVLCGMGSPQLLRGAAAMVATFSSTVTSEVALAKWLFGDLRK
jgi:beta-N-acetylhexosaminidase